MKMQFPRRNKARLITALMACVGLAGLIAGAARHPEARQDAPAQQAATEYPIAPEILPGGQWVREPTTIAANRGKVIVLAFWTHECINCKRTLPYWNQWAKHYAPKEGKPGDVAVISVHTPELASERVFENVKSAVQKHGLVFPVVTDNQSKNWNAYNVQAWPTTILIDKQGRIRGRWQGELNWERSGEYARVLSGIEMLRKEKP